jgi:glycolate oxidase
MNPHASHAGGARGAGTGLSGGATAAQRRVSCCRLAKFNRILSIDRWRAPPSQPGVRNLAISEAAAPHGLYYAPDPSSQIACTIGGNVAENSGGVHCLKYGLTVHNVLRVRDGADRRRGGRLGGKRSTAPGYDLLALMTGSEGCSASSPRSPSSSCRSRSVARACWSPSTTSRSAGNAWPTSSPPGIIPAAWR